MAARLSSAEIEITAFSASERERGDETDDDFGGSFIYVGSSGRPQLAIRADINLP